MNTLISRKAVKVFQKNHQIPKNILDQILTDTMRAPSSFNLQPWHFFVIANKGSKSKLKPCLCSNESQLETSSAIILVCGHIQNKETRELILRQSFAAKKWPIPAQDQALARINLLYQQKTEPDFKNELFLDCGIVSLQLMLAAKSYGYDSCPIGGFNRKTINQAFDIDKDFVPILLIALGKTPETLSQPSAFRLPFEKITTYL